MQSMSIPTPPTIHTKNYNRSVDGAQHPLSVRASATTVTNTTLAHEPVYHWTLVLTLADPPRTVTLDPIPGADLPTAVLLVSSEPTSPATCNDAPAFAVQPAPGRTVDEFIRFITDTGLDRFRFDVSGSGCRHWCGAMLREWERAGFVERGSAEAFARWVRELHAREPGRVPMPLREGTWY